MEISERKRAANKANAQKSTGPRSISGKLTSSSNSGRHRYLSSAVVLDSECHQRFAAILTSFNAEHNPQDSTEQAFVERMAVCHWRLLRVWAMETADIRYAQKHQSGAILQEDAPTRAAVAVRQQNETERHPDPIGRRETRYSREFYAALAALDKYRDRKNTNKATDFPDSKGPASIVEAIEAPIEATLQPVEATMEPIEPTVDLRPAA